jgi:hypothetical protein
MCAADGDCRIFKIQQIVSLQFSQPKKNLVRLMLMAAVAA